MDPKIIADQKIMEEFFEKNLQIFPDTKKLKSLKVQPHAAHQIFDDYTILVEYKLVLVDEKDNEFSLSLRGSSDLSEKRNKHHQILKQLQKHGFRNGVNIVATPVGYFPQYNLLLYKNINGQSLFDKFKWVERPEWEQKIWDAVNWLVEFHSKKITGVSGLNQGLWEEKERFDLLVKSLTKKFPGHKKQISQTVNKITKQEQKLLKPENFVLIHGDYQPNNILFTDEPYQTAVVDFNDSMLYDELYDLATFLTQTKEMVWRVKKIEIQNLLEQIRDHYLYQRKITKNEIILEKLSLFRTKILLHIKAVSDHDQAKRILNEIEKY